MGDNESNSSQTTFNKDSLIGRVFPEFLNDGSVESDGSTTIDPEDIKVRVKEYLPEKFELTEEDRNELDEFMKQYNNEHENDTLNTNDVIAEMEAALKENKATAAAPAEAEAAPAEGEAEAEAAAAPAEKPSKKFCETGEVDEDNGEKYNPNIHNMGRTPEERCTDDGYAVKLETEGEAEAAAGKDEDNNNSQPEPINVDISQQELIDAINKNNEQLNPDETKIVSTEGGLSVTVQNKPNLGGKSKKKQRKPKNKSNKKMKNKQTKKGGKQIKKRSLKRKMKK